MSKDIVKVLLVESDQEDYLLIQNLLSRARGAQFALQWVQDFQDAGLAMAGADYDACLLDDRLGKEGGLDLVRETLLARTNVPVIIISQHDEYSSDVSAMQAGAKDYLIKSQLSVDLLERSIRYAIANKRIEYVLRHTSIEQVPLPAVIADLPIGVIITDPQQMDNPLVFVNPAFTTITGYQQEESLGRNCRYLQCPETDQDTVQALRVAIRNQQLFKGTVLNRRKDGTLFWNALVLNPVFDMRGRLANFVGLVTDVTETVENEMKRVRLAAIIESSHEAIIGLSTTGEVDSWNQAAERMFGYTAAEMLGQPLARQQDEEKKKNLILAEAGIIETEQLHGFDMLRSHKNGRLMDISLTVSPIKDEKDVVTGASIIARNITQRKQQQDQIERQLRRIQSLRTIDMAITSSLDLRLTLNILLDEVTTHLGVDCAAVLLLNEHTQRLEYSAGRGFRSMALQRTQLRIGEGYAGKAALQRRMIQVANLALEPGDLTRATMLGAEELVAYYAMPLIAKGQVEGVLEIFHRSPLIVDDEWVYFLEALAGQAAIAIDNATLFSSLQLSNQELQLAYDSTLEGWSKALDLRDKETEGHTQRVTAGTTILAQAMCIPDRDLMHIRRGALLHDIGKMGIPDSILLKPGPLTEEEWVIMRQHPVYAFELISPIAYLKPALDIPYCHHEKWDGSGYPRGLKGAQIPLAARLFAVIDVWDALRSDRPYRAGWPTDGVAEHIRKGAGTHFDPAVVEVFDRIDLLPILP
jgi:PAS domain S-box-containing protein